MGFEPTTSGATTRRSNQLSYAHRVLVTRRCCGSVPDKDRTISGVFQLPRISVACDLCVEVGTPGRTRTCISWIRSPVPYPIRLRGHYVNILWAPSYPEARFTLCRCLFRGGLILIVKHRLTECAISSFRT